MRRNISASLKGAADQAGQRGRQLVEEIQRSAFGLETFEDDDGGWHAGNDSLEQLELEKRGMRRRPGRHVDFAAILVDDDRNVGVTLADTLDAEEGFIQSGLG